MPMKSLEMGTGLADALGGCQGCMGTPVGRLSSLQHTRNQPWFLETKG